MTNGPRYPYDDKIGLALEKKRADEAEREIGRLRAILASFDPDTRREAARDSRRR